MWDSPARKFSKKSDENKSSDSRLMIQHTRKSISFNYPENLT